MSPDCKMSFETHRGTVVSGGTVLSYDEYLTLPLRIEYWTASGDKRIERFTPAEFIWMSYDGY